MIIVPFFALKQKDQLAKHFDNFSGTQNLHILLANGWVACSGRETARESLLKGKD
jgi:hypothetical protein